MKKTLTAIVLSIVFSACSEHGNNRALLPAAGSNVIFKRTDSVELIYYPNPANQKDYKFVRSSDSTLISLLLRDLQSDSIPGSACTHYNKLYLFAGAEVYKTVYVSDSCNYLAFVVNGKQQYRRLSAETWKEIAWMVKERRPG